MDEETRGRILVVEDDPEAALFLVHVLANRCRFEVIHTADPGTALRLAAGEHWDLVVTDLDMPGMTGLELLRIIRSEFPTLRVMMVTAYGDEKNFSKAMETGANEFVTKPVDFVLLKEKILKLRDVQNPV